MSGGLRGPVWVYAGIGLWGSGRGLPCVCVCVPIYEYPREAKRNRRKILGLVDEIAQEPRKGPRQYKYTPAGLSARRGKIFGVVGGITEA